MLKQRILTAAVLIPLIVLAIFKLPNSAFALLLGVFVALGFWEWAGLMGLGDSTDRAMYLMLVAPLLVGAGFLPGGLLVGITIGAAWWLIALAWVWRFNTRPVSGPPSVAMSGICGALVLAPAWMALVVLHGTETYGPRYVLFLMVLVWLADTGAYFAGRMFGKHKLAPNVSPGKTWEGVWAALVVGLGMGVVGGRLLEINVQLQPAFMSLCVITVALSIAGDLLESMFKRRAGVKDSGTLLPGHGGVLDRIDSLTAAAPVFVGGLLFLGTLVP
ncbi:MAG: phosphatidate cytidylyltransferase [Gammaproteobacteria bacterium]|nr:phosphatidate cytidylyltransferase [Gammaproteobacteria bacterium]